MNNRNIKKISKISDIKRTIKCRCGNGNIELITIIVSPRDGKIALSYKYCTSSVCPYRRGKLIFTDIIMPQLILGESENNK